MAYLYKHLSTRILRNIQNVLYPYLNEYSKSTLDFYNKTDIEHEKVESIDIKIGIGHALESYLEIFNNEDDNWINFKEARVRDKINGINAPKLPRAVMIEVNLEFTKTSNLHISTNLLERKFALDILERLILEDYTFNDKELKEYWS